MIVIQIVMFLHLTLLKSDFILVNCEMLLSVISV